MKMYLQTLGDALITVGQTEIRPTAPMMFAVRRELDVLKSAPEARVTHVQRSIKAYELLIPLCEGSLRVSDLSFSELEWIDDRSRRMFEHQHFAVGLLGAYLRAGEVERGRARMEAYLRTYRRERYSPLHCIEASPLPADVRDCAREIIQAPEMLRVA